ncbi:helix-turn-helix transcriptional regulator [Streptomyces sp. NPDC002763]|uniref:helix-turn-helix transcriptional regulator n=1 Tax=Streptomyces sp. NPDC002763 TaxID=3154427 RepID=UPI003319509C
MATAIPFAGPGGPGSLRRAELAEFLRSRRERLTPQQAGVIHIGRRRTPGLRREEVAQLSGMSTTWYTWLEQGRDIKVSDQVLDSLSRTLQLDHDERSHLFALAGAPDPTTTTECDAVTPQMRAVLAKLDPYPACVQGGKYDLLAYNTALRLLFTDLDEVPRDQRNCVWLTFTHPAWRESVVNWEATAARMVANLRVAMADHVGDPLWRNLVSRLRAVSPEFAELWDRHTVAQVEDSGVRTIRNAIVGELRFEVSNTWLAPRSGHRLQVFAPADSETERRLADLVGRTPHLRSAP